MLASVNLTNLENRLLRDTAIFGVLAVLASILYWQPFWGLMDDGHNLIRMREIAEVGFWQRYLIDIKSEISWGMLRMFILPMYYLIYGPFQESPTLAFLWNFILVVGITYWLARTLARHGVTKSIELILGWDLTDTSVTRLIFVLMLAFPWFYFLFSSPSLQEKLVFIGLAINISILTNPRWQKAALFYPLSLLALSIGFCTKTQFVFLMPSVLGFYLFSVLSQANDKSLRALPWLRIAFITIVSIIWTVILMRISSQGSYTAGGFSIDKIWVNLRASKSFWLFSLVNLTAIACLGFWIRKNIKNQWWQTLPLLTPILSGQLFITAMLGWRLGGYLNSFLAPFISISLMVGFLAAVRFSVLRRGVFFLLVLFVGLVSLWLPYTHMSFLSSIRNVVHHETTAGIVEAGHPIFFTGMEGSDHLKNYIRTATNNSSALVLTADSDRIGSLEGHLREANPEFTYWFMAPKWTPIANQSAMPLDFAKGEKLIDGGSDYQLSLWKIPVSR